MNRELYPPFDNQISQITPLGKDTCSFIRQEAKTLALHNEARNLLRKKWEKNFSKENSVLYNRVKSQEQLYEDIELPSDTFLCGALLMYRAFQDEALQKGGVPIKISERDYQEYLWDRQQKTPQIHEVLTSTVAEDIEVQLEKFAVEQKKATTKVLQNREQPLLFSVFPYVSVLDDEKRDMFVEGLKSVYFPVLYVQTRTS